jgi:hypothetical protein
VEQGEGSSGQFTFFKNANMTPNIVFSEKQYGYQKTQNFMLIQNSFLFKVMGKNIENSVKL